MLKTDPCGGVRWWDKWADNVWGAGSRASLGSVEEAPGTRAGDPGQKTKHREEPQQSWRKDKRFIKHS